jgi:hypothetical protein
MCLHNPNYLKMERKCFLLCFFRYVDSVVMSWRTGCSSQHLMMARGMGCSSQHLIPTRILSAALLLSLQVSLALSITWHHPIPSHPESKQVGGDGHDVTVFGRGRAIPVHHVPLTCEEIRELPLLEFLGAGLYKASYLTLHKNVSLVLRVAGHQGLVLILVSQDKRESLTFRSQSSISISEENFGASPTNGKCFGRSGGSWGMRHVAPPSTSVCTDDAMRRTSWPMSLSV